MFSEEVQKQLAFIVFLIFLVTLEGVVGYKFIEGWELLDAFFMTIITLSTVGYHEVHALSTGGKIFTVVLIVTGMGVFWYAVGQLTSFLIEADIRGKFRRRKMDKTIRALHDHIIVCGYGRNGQEAVAAIRSRGIDCIFIDRSSKVISEHAPNDLLAVSGDAKEEDVLLKCNIKEAKGLIAALPNDADNVYITLTARRLNPKLMIVSRASEDASQKNLQMVGADRVVLPDRIGGMRMAMEILDPTIVEFLGLLRSPRPEMPRLGQFTVKESSPLVGEKIGDCLPAALSGCFFVALQRDDRTIFPASQPQEKMEKGDRLIVFGLPEQIHALQ